MNISNSSNGTWAGDDGADRECCLLACRCWLDIDFTLGLTDRQELLMLLPVLACAALSVVNIGKHGRAIYEPRAGLEQRESLAAHPSRGLDAPTGATGNERSDEVMRTATEQQRSAGEGIKWQ